MNESNLQNLAKGFKGSESVCSIERISNMAQERLSVRKACGSVSARFREGLKRGIQRTYHITKPPCSTLGEGVFSARFLWSDNAEK